MSMFSRGVRGQGRITKIGCPNPTCEGTLYELQPGEALGRSVQAGKTNVEKKCRCETCGLERSITVQVRVTR